ncbi:MAG: glycosyltransferase [Anaerolineales bacterium]|nr:glycosyltransferase [Anaerolineales bacterium]
MRILVVHNRYQLPGGEDSVVEQEIAMLRHAGHEVITYSRSNDEVQLLALRGQLLLPLRAVWARDTVRDVQSLVRQSSPDVVHVHNTHFMISPSVYHACKSLGVPVVQTVHNCRLVCPNALLLRDGHVCEDCLGKIAAVCQG